MVEPIEESSFIEYDVHECNKESFAEVEYEEIRDDTLPVCEFSPDSIVSARKGPFGDRITLNNSFDDAVDVAQLCKLFMKLCKQYSQYLELNKIAPFHWF